MDVPQSRAHCMSCWHDQASSASPLTPLNVRAWPVHALQLLQRHYEIVLCLSMRFGSTLAVLSNLIVSCHRTNWASWYAT